MNNNLTNQIIAHIFSNLGLMELKVPTSLMDSKFLTDLTIEYETEDYDETTTHKANVWIAQSTNKDEPLITLTCSKFNNNENEISEPGEIVIFIEIEKCPTYACYLNDDKLNGLIAFSIKENIWILADIYTQALFLAGMEKFKDLSFKFDKCKDPKTSYSKLIKFIEWYDEELNK